MSATIHPTEVKGAYIKAREFVRIFLVLAILGLPWLRIDDHQALLLDIAHRKFSIFGLLFFAQDIPLLFLLTITFVLGVALITALFGRVWCGWMCPQTVIIDGVFRRIERWTEGNAEQRRKNESLPLNGTRVIQKTIKWILFSVSTLLITHSILAIFIGSDHLLEIINRPFDENPTALLFIAVSNFVLLVDFGILREQFCIVACPYGKFQSVMQDKYTVSVAYDTSRTDCVDCFRCVRVCPTGIDIRQGSQLECVACTACIDACNDVMTRIKKPKNLIGYFSEAQILAAKQVWLRPRVLIYSSLILLFGGVALYEIVTHKPFEVMIYKTKGKPFSVVKDAALAEKVTNVFNAELSNKSTDPIRFTLKLTEGSEAILVMPNNSIVLESGKVQSNPFTLEFDKNILDLGSADQKIIINAKNLNTDQEWSSEQPIHVIGPY